MSQSPQPPAVTQSLVDQVVDLSHQAGELILEVYHHSEGIKVASKDDDSPITKADMAAHHLLEPGLEQLIAGVPVLSEESPMPDFDLRKTWQTYWLIDPLDGTKEFINRNGEFTVNVALIDKGVPILGVVYVPVTGVTYVGSLELGAVKLKGGQSTPIQVRTIESRVAQKLPVELVASRRHGSEEVELMLQRLGAELGEVATKNMGSSLKLCLVAEGEADLYPRLALTSEWDTAAAQAVVEAAGGTVVDTDFNLLRYNTKDDILNPYFYVIGDKSFDWRKLLN